MNKKGSTMVEATFIYPLVIGSIMCVVYIIINMYILLSCNVALSLDLREKLMLETETGFVENASESLENMDLYTDGVLGKEVTVCVKRDGVMEKLSGSISRQMKGNILLKSLVKEQKKERWLVDEKKYIRNIDLLSPT